MYIDELHNNMKQSDQTHLHGIQQSRGAYLDFMLNCTEIFGHSFRILVAWPQNHRVFF